MGHAWNCWLSTQLIHVSFRAVQQSWEGRLVDCSFLSSIPPTLFPSPHLLSKSFNVPVVSVSCPSPFGWSESIRGTENQGSRGGSDSSQSILPHAQQIIATGSNRGKLRTATRRWKVLSQSQCRSSFSLSFNRQAAGVGVPTTPNSGHACGT